MFDRSTAKKLAASDIKSLNFTRFKSCALEVYGIIRKFQHSQTGKGHKRALVVKLNLFQIL